MLTFKYLSIYLFIKYLFLTNFYIECGTQAYNPEIKSCVSTPEISLFYKKV